MLGSLNTKKTLVASAVALALCVGFVGTWRSVAADEVGGKVATQRSWGDYVHLNGAVGLEATGPNGEPGLDGAAGFNTTDSNREAGLDNERPPVVDANADTELRPHWFAKMGGSSVESRAFLHCLATQRVQLGEFEPLRPTLDRFAADRVNAFNRTSLAAGTNWNLKYALSGSPAFWQREVDAVRPMWALVLFGSNDAQNRNERIYARRLLALVDALRSRGVVPILGSAPPRRSEKKERWVRRFNHVTAAIARARKLPFIDYHAAMTELPGLGLARDGVHPNVRGHGGLQRACEFDERGLRYGHPVRNLLTLWMLDALSTSSSKPIVARDPATSAFPFSELLPKRRFSNDTERYPECARRRYPGAEYVAEVTLRSKRRLRFTALDLTGRKTQVFVRPHQQRPDSCVASRVQSVIVELQPGVWDFVAELSPAADTRGELLVVIAEEP